MAPPNNHEEFGSTARLPRDFTSGISGDHLKSSVGCVGTVKPTETPAVPKAVRPLQDPSVREPTAFLSDEEISRNWFFQWVQWLVCGYATIMYRFSVEGDHRMPKDEPVLLVSLHTYHSSDIAIVLMNAQKIAGRVVRGLMHRSLMKVAGWIRFIGAVPGHRDTAQNLLRQGFWVAVIPGGAEEIMWHATDNGKTAYETWWNTKEGVPRAGFARVACSMGPGFKVFPCFSENGEEMKFNPLADLWTWFRLDHLYGAFARMMPTPVRWVLFQVAIIVTFTVSNFGIPVPVKVTQHVGEAVVVQEGETPESLALRVQQALQKLIDEKQGRRHRDYIAALKERWMPSGESDEKKDS